MRPDILCISNFGRDQANLDQAGRRLRPEEEHEDRRAGDPAQSAAGGAAPDVYEGVVGGAQVLLGHRRARSRPPRPSTTAFGDGNAARSQPITARYGYTGVYSLLLAVQAAGGTDSEKVIAALEALKYDVAKGPQYYRKCDHQSVQSVLIVESKKKRHEGRDRLLQDGRCRAGAEADAAHLRRTRPTGRNTRARAPAWEITSRLLCCSSSPGWRSAPSTCCWRSACRSSSAC